MTPRTVRHAIASWCLIGFAALASLEGAATAQILMHERFTGAAGWTADPPWQIGAAVGTNCTLWTDADEKPNGGVACNLSGACVAPTATPPLTWLTSPPIDASGATHLRFEWDQWLWQVNGGTDSAQLVQVFDAIGNSWSSVWTNGGPNTPASWSHVVLDISSYYAKPTFRVRFGFIRVAGAAASWSIDNVRVTNGQHFFDRFTNNDAGWTLGPQWQIGDATASVGCATNIGYFDDPSHDADGTPTGRIAGAVLGGCVGGTTHPQYHMTSPVIDTSAAGRLRLEFDRWLNSDPDPYMNSVVEVFDGANWILIYATPLPVADSSWVHVGYDVTAYKNAAFRVRFGFATAANAYDTSGWNIDNVILFDPSGFSLTLWAYNGPGSIRVKAHASAAAIPPGTTLFNCFTVLPGAYPYGWFFGLDPSFNDILGQFTSGALPFVGTTNAVGDIVFDLPSGMPPGLTLYGVSVALSPALTVLGASPPVSFVTL